MFESQYTMVDLVRLTALFFVLLFLTQEPDTDSYDIEKENSRPKRSGRSKQTINYCEDEDQTTRPKGKISTGKGEGRETGKNIPKNSASLNQDDDDIQDVSVTKGRSKKSKTKQNFANKEAVFQETDRKSKRKKNDKKSKEAYEANSDMVAEDATVCKGKHKSMTKTSDDVIEEDDDEVVTDDTPVPKGKRKPKKIKPKTADNVDIEVLQHTTEVPKAKDKSQRSKVKQKGIPREDNEEVVPKRESPVPKKQNVNNVSNQTQNETEQPGEIAIEDKPLSNIENKPIDITQQKTTENDGNSMSTEAESADKLGNICGSLECGIVIKQEVIDVEEVDVQDYTRPNENSRSSSQLGRIISEIEDEVVHEDSINRDPRDVLEIEDKDNCMQVQQESIETIDISSQKKLENSATLLKSADKNNNENERSNYANEGATCQTENIDCGDRNVTVSEINNSAGSLNSTYVLEENEPTEHKTKASENVGCLQGTSPKVNIVTSVQDNDLCEGGVQNTPRHIEHVASEEKILTKEKCLETTISIENQSEVSGGDVLKCSEVINSVCIARQECEDKLQGADMDKTNAKKDHQQKQYERSHQPDNLLEKIKVVEVSL